MHKLFAVPPLYALPASQHAYRTSVSWLQKGQLRILPDTAETGHQHAISLQTEGSTESKTGIHARTPADSGMHFTLNSTVEDTQNLSKMIDIRHAQTPANPFRNSCKDSIFSIMRGTGTEAQTGTGLLSGSASLPACSVGLSHWLAAGKFYDT